MGWSQVGQSQGRSGCCLESCSCPSRCPVCAPFATSFSLSVGSRSCCLPAGVFFGWHNGSAVCSTARVASAAGQATATSPANSERSSESSPKPIAQADPGSGPPSRRAAICRACVRRHRHHRRRLRDRRLRACAPPPSARTTCLLHTQLVSSRLVAMSVHGERRRHHACGQGPRFLAQEMVLLKVPPIFSVPPGP